MALTVVTPPEPFLTPADIAGTHADDDATVAAMISAVVSELDAPNGWLGRALGQQTLKLTMGDFDYDELNRRREPASYNSRYTGRLNSRIWLPYPDVSTVVSVKYLDTYMVEQTVSSDIYRLADGWLVLKPGKVWPTVACDQPDAVRITYTTGYSTVPDHIKHAIILMVQQLKATNERTGSSALFLQSETVEGIGQFRYALDAKLAEYVQNAASSLVSSSRVYR